MKAITAERRILPVGRRVSALSGRGRSTRALVAVWVVGSLLLGAAGAEARCGDSWSHRSQFKINLPFLMHEAQGDGHSAETIVGLWHVTYTTSDGNFFYEAFDHWHADGTEFENANFNPIEGDVCLGIWRPTGLRSAQVNHFGWSYDTGGNSNGTFNITENVALGADGLTYTGTFNYTVYDTAGNVVLPVLTGKISAARITMATQVEK